MALGRHLYPDLSTAELKVKSFAPGCHGDDSESDWSEDVKVKICTSSFLNNKNIILIDIETAVHIHICIFL